MRGDIIIFLLAIFFFNNVEGQRKPLDTPTLVVKYSPISLIDFYTPAFQVSGEYFLSDKISLNLDAGYLFRYFNFRDNQLFGYRLRPSVRFYKHSNRNPKAYKFRTIEVMFKDAYSKKNDWFCRQDCSYLENIQYNRRAETISFNSGFGRLYNISQQFKIEWHLSFGLRRIEYSTKNLPEDATVSNLTPTFFGNSLNTGTYFLPSMVIGFKLGWVLID